MKFGDFRRNFGQLARLGADLNATNDWGGTALTKAAERGKVDCVQVLLDAGADRSLRVESDASIFQGKTAHYIAKKLQHKAVAKALKSKPKVAAEQKKAKADSAGEPAGAGAAVDDLMQETMEERPD